MTTDLAAFAKEKGVKYFMVSFTDLFGAQRAKLVPTQAIADMQEEGAGFAGFASWLDMTPAHADMLAVPDPSSVIQLPWKREVAWVALNANAKLKLERAEFVAWDARSASARRDERERRDRARSARCEWARTAHERRSDGPDARNFARDRTADL